MAAAAGYSDASYKAPRGCVPTNPHKRRLLFFGLPIGLILVAAIAIGAAVSASQDKQNKTTAGGSSRTTSQGTQTTTSAGSTTTTAAPTNNFGVAGSGADGSMVQMADGGNFTYYNSFGGTWAVDPADPYSVSNRVLWQGQALNHRSRAERNNGHLACWRSGLGAKITLGGALTKNLDYRCQADDQCEPRRLARHRAVHRVLPVREVPTHHPRCRRRIHPMPSYGLRPPHHDGESLQEFHRQPLSIYTRLCANSQTEVDFADIAAAGLNWVRIPLGFWAIETNEDEPYLGKVSWNYFVKAIGWARKYGLRILLDFHALPGSQNGWNHSGRAGSVNWMYGVMGLVNAQRHLEQIRSLTEFISQPGIKEVVPMMSLVNEVQASIVGEEVLSKL